MPIEQVTRRAPRRVRWPAFTQDWSDVTFLHWPVRPRRVAELLPPRVRPDTLDGLTYVGLVALVMRRTTVARGPALAYVGAFQETNVRLYSIDQAGRRGVVFLSMDASRLLTVLAARWGTGLPYTWARMRHGRRGDRIGYTCRRRWPGSGPASRLVVRVGAPVEPDPMADFLTARWGLHLAGPGRRAWYWPLDHPPWRLHAGMLERFDDGLLAAAGFGELSGTPPASVLHSGGVTTAFGLPRPA